jgi:hypothetical protein
MSLGFKLRNITMFHQSNKRLPDDAALDLAFIALNLAADRGVKSS